jgi:hypothetical protein
MTIPPMPSTAAAHTPNANLSSSTSAGERVTQENEKDRGEKVARGTQVEEEMVDIEKSNILLV